MIKLLRMEKGIEMIVGNINNAQKYYMLNEAFKDAFEYLKTLDVESKGGFEFDNFKGGISSYETSDYTADGKLKPIEAHKDYIDIHFVIDGSEGIGYADIETLTPITDYNKEKDYILLDGNMSKIILQKGEFFIAFPEDGHTPSMSGCGTKNVKKAVVKIKA